MVSVSRYVPFVLARFASTGSVTWTWGRCPVAVTAAKTAFVVSEAALWTPVLAAQVAPVWR
jgi:hypothetical protein